MEKQIFKMTKARKLILEVFGKGCDMLSSDEIFQKVRKNGIDRVTVYRNMGFLEEAGILKKIQRQRIAYYESAQHHHHHIMCKKCGASEEYSADICSNGILQEALNKIAKSTKKFKLINDHSLEFFGVCKICHNKK